MGGYARISRIINMHWVDILNRIWPRVKVNEKSGCWEWQGCTHNRSGHGRTRHPVTQKMVYVHRLMYELAKGEIPPLEVVRHKCDNPRCCRPAHLELGSVQDNAQDRLERGGYSVKLDFQVAERIRLDHAKGATVDRLAWDYSISRATVYDVIKHRTWNPDR